MDNRNLMFEGSIDQDKGKFGWEHTDLSWSQNCNCKDIPEIARKNVRDCMNRRRE
jgi:hypothetical protein